MEKIIARIINKFLSKFGIYLQKVKRENTALFDKVKITKENIVLADEIEITKEDILDIEIQNFVNRNRWLRDFKIEAVLDIGANEGQFAEKISALMPNVKVICFEPLQEPFEKLRKKFGSNKNFFLFRCALGNSEGRQQIYRNEYSPSSSILKMKSSHKEAFDFTRKEFEEEIKIKKMDKILGGIKINSPYLVKIDVQGYKLLVIDGGVNTIENASMIILETSFVKLYENAPLFDDIYKKLESLNFKYAGSFEQLLRPGDMKILQQDSIFLKNPSNEKK